MEYFFSCVPSSYWSYLIRHVFDTIVGPQRRTAIVMTDQYLIWCAHHQHLFLTDLFVTSVSPVFPLSLSLSVRWLGFGPDYFWLTTQRPQTQSDNVKGPLCHFRLCCGRHRMQLSLSRRRIVMKNTAVSSLCRRNTASWEKGTQGGTVRKITAAPPSLI